MCDNVIFGRLCDLWMESPDVSGACTRGVERGETTVISTVGILWSGTNGDVIYRRKVQHSRLIIYA